MGIADLERLVAEGTALAGGPHQCTKIGHKWISLGGANAGCSDVCSCSVPVHECDACGDCDYGENDEAEQIRSDCLALRD